MTDLETATNVGVEGNHKGKMWSPQQMFVMFMLLLIMLSNYLDRLIMTIIQEPIKLEMGLTDTQLGLITGPAFGLLYGLSAVPIARLADRFNRINILSISLAVWSGFTMICAATNSYIQLFIARMGVGAAEGGGAPSVYSLVAEFFTPRQRGFATAVLGMANPLAGFLAPLVGAYVAATYGWRWAFIAVGLPGLIIALAFKLTVKDPRSIWKKTVSAEERPAPTKFINDMKWLVKNKSFVLIFLASMMGGAVMISTLLFTGSFFLRQYDISIQKAGLVLSIGLGVGGLLGALIGGWVSDRFSGENGRSYMFVPSVGALGAGTFYFCTYSVSSWEVAAGFLVAATVFQTFKNGPNFAAVQTLVPNHMRATASAVLLLAISMFGSSIGPTMVGLMSDYFANGHFLSSLGSYAEQCSGPAATWSAEVKDACSDASAFGLKSSLRIIAVMYIIPVVLYYIAGKSLRLDMDAEN